MSETHLFLFGGGPPFNKNLGEKFSGLAGNSTARVAVLFLERPGWELIKYEGSEPYVYD